MIELIKTCEEAARLGGRILLDWRSRFTVREKGPSDLVTQADLEAQQAIEAFIHDRFPDHMFVGEESTTTDPAGNEATLDSQYCWIVDPLDGTMNYVHGLPNYATSVAVAQKGRVVAGAVYDPVLDECFTARSGEASAGGGAWLNGDPIQVSGQVELSQALVAVSFPTRLSRNSKEVQELLAMMPHCQGFRRMGSAALNLCYIASGRMDAYWSTTTKVWDVAAGLLLVTEAGGIATAPHGGELDLKSGHFLCAASSALHQQVLRIIKDL